MAKRKRSKQKHTINNVVIGISVVALGFFYYQSRNMAGSRSMQRTPQDAITAFAERLQSNYSNLTQYNMLGPKSGMPEEMEDVPLDDGWAGLHVFFLEEDMEWLKANADLISLGDAIAQGLKVEDWRKWGAWERFVRARTAMLRYAPRGDSVSIGQSTPEDQEGNIEVSVSTGARSTSVRMRKVRGAWVFVGWFGQKGLWESQFTTIQSMM